MSIDLRAEALVPTSNAAKYAGQLCKHFKHKVEAAFADGRGEVDFRFAKASLIATDAGLSLSCWADDLQGLGRAKHVLEDHLRRFAFREALGPFDWSGPETPPPPAT